MTELEKAYFIMGIEAGYSLEVVTERYKDLAMAWHSDRYPSGDKKAKAEEEMKKINNARDVLKKHFASGHKQSGPCDCRPGAKASQTSPPPQQGNKEEDAARRRNAQRAAEEERARKSAEAADRARQASQQAEADRTQAAPTNAVDQQKQVDDEALRWRLAIGIVAAWIVVSLFSIVTLGLEHVWHNIATSIEHAFEKHDNPTPPAPSNSDNGTTYTPPQVPSNDSAMAPPQDAALDQISEQAKRDREAQNQKTADILRLQNDIDRAQKVIDHCNQEISQTDTQLANPLLAISEKLKITSYQNQQRDYLSQAQIDFNTAQKLLADLTGSQAPAPIPFAPHVVPQPTFVDSQDLRRRASEFLNPTKASTPTATSQSSTTQMRSFSDLLKPSQLGR